jgi:hypothetical protein
LASATILFLTACDGNTVPAVSANAQPEQSPPIVGPDASDYTAAARVFEANLTNAVKNTSVEPHWLDERGAFWYRRDADDGHEYVVVDVSTGEKSHAFDHEALAATLTGVLEESVTANHLGLSNEVLGENLDTLNAIAQGKSVECDLAGMSCSASEIESPEPGLLVSPGGEWAAKSRDHNLYLVDTASGDERQLTTDGEPFHSWGKLPDTSLITIPTRKSGRKAPPFGAIFSPDDRYLIIPRLDERNVAVNPFVEWVPTDGSLRPVVHEIRSPLMGDRNGVEREIFIFDTNTGTFNPIRVPDEYQDGLAGIVLGWSSERNQAFMTAATTGGKKAALFRIDLASGKTEKVVEESSATRVEHNSYMYNRPNVWVAGDGAEVIWYSDRSGWGHLYLYDAQTGELKNTITSGEWLVQDIHHLDEENRSIYFTGGGREAGRDLFHRGRPGSGPGPLSAASVQGFVRRR